MLKCNPERRFCAGVCWQLPVDLAARITGDPNSATMAQQAGIRCAVTTDEEREPAIPDSLFIDEFTDPNSGWYVGSGSNPGYHAPDWYHLEALPSGPLVLLGPEGNSNRGNLSMVAEIFLSPEQSIIDGDFRYGLIARRSDDQSYYAFMISPDSKTWSVVKQTPDGPIEIASGPDETIAGSDLRNWIRLDTSGQSFLFWINGRLAYQFSDPEAPLNGNIGFIVETLGASKAHIHVDYAEVTELKPNLLPAPIQAVTITPIETNTPVPTVAAEPMLSPTLVPTPTMDPNQLPTDPVLGTEWQRPQDAMTMVYVPAGTFSMGSEDGNDNEKPAHEVSLDGFWIDQMEVSNEQFTLFVDGIGYKTTAEKEGTGWTVIGSEWVEVDGANWQHPLGPDSDLADLEDHPVTLISWTDALAYCAWSGAMLPSEAQWEYAARGPESLDYPWGSEFDGQKNNYCDQNCPMDWKDDSFDDNFARTAPVSSFADGASWVGALDMVGNLWEWVNDWHGETYYANSPVDNPTGPDDGTEKVLKGGAWVNQPIRMRGSDRNIIEPTFRTSTFGFRCALPGE